MKTHSLLWIAPRNPVPPQDGARRATYNLVQHLAGEGLAVDYLVLKAKGETVDIERMKRELSLRHVFVIDREKSSPVNILKYPLDPMTYAPFCTSQVRRSWELLAKEHRWDAMVFDGLHAAALFSQRGVFVHPSECRVSLHRSHNVETQLWKREAALSRGPRRWALLLQGWMVERFEKSVLEQMRHTGAISPEDLTLFREMAPSATADWLPLGFDVSGSTLFQRPTDVLNPQLLFIGRLDWPPNRTGLKWFLDQVWPEAVRRRPDLKLRVVGSGDSSWLDSYRHLTGVTQVGPVEKVEPEYARVWATIVPVFYGSGVRVKALESFVNGRACLSTSLGVSGTGARHGEHFIKLETAEEWIQALVSLQYEELMKLGKNSADWMVSRYNAVTIATNYRRLIQTAIEQDTI